MNLDEKKPENSEVERKKQQARMMVLNLAMEFGFLIAIPLILFVLAGRWLDNKYQHHFFVVIGIFAALAISTLLIGRRISEIRKRLR